MEDRKPLTDGESRILSTACSRSGDLIFSEHKIELAHNVRHYQSDGVMPFIGMQTNPDYSSQDHSVQVREFDSPIRRSRDNFNSNTERYSSHIKDNSSRKGQLIIPEPFAEGRPLPWERPLKEEAKQKLLDDLKRRYDRSYSREKRELSRDREKREQSRDKAEKIELFSVVYINGAKQITPKSSRDINSDFTNITGCTCSRFNEGPYRSLVS